MKTFFSSLLIVFATLFAMSAHADTCNLLDINETKVGSLSAAIAVTKPTYTGANQGAIWRVGNTANIAQNAEGICIPVTVGDEYSVKIFNHEAFGSQFRLSYAEMDSSGIVTKGNTSYSSNGQTITAENTGFLCIQFAVNTTAEAVANSRIMVVRGTDVPQTYQPYNPLCATCQGIVKTYESATGTVAQNGTPSPTNPIEPVFYTQGDMILRKVGDYADSYDATTGKITRRVGVKVLDGTESWQVVANVYIKSDATAAFIPIVGMIQTITADFLCTQLKPDLNEIWQQVGYPNTAQIRTNVNGAQFMVNFGNDIIGITDYTQETRSSAETKIKNYIAQQYAAGTPVTVWYPLETPVEEDWPSSYCQPSIKIATTAYNTARFSPVVTDLNNAVATIREIVTNTINQTAAIASLQADKQTRPEDACPAGKKCLLVETEENGVIVPHWFPIIENIYGLPAGYTALEYIQSDGASYLIVPYRVNNKTVFYCRYNEIQKGPQTGSAVFGVTNEPDGSKANYGILRLLDGAGTVNRMGWGDSTSGSIINVNAPQNLDTWYEVLYDQNKLYQNNTLYATSATQPSTSWTANYDLGIFARNGSSVTMPAVAKISSVWAKENGEYKINLVPAKRNSDNVVGMYDTVNDRFYTNAGTGTFTAGPEI